MTYALLTALSYLCTKFVGLERTIRLFETVGAKLQSWFRPKKVKSPQAIYEAVRKGYGRIPFAIRCLDQAVVTWSVLNFHGYDARLKIGIMLSPLTSHAWVEFGNLVFVDSSWIPDMQVLADYPAWKKSCEIKSIAHPTKPVPHA